MNNFFKPSENCWKLETADRVSFIIDGEDYFKALYETFERARKSIMIVGWDLHSGVKLVRDGANNGRPAELGRYLDWLARERQDLSIYLLSWDFAMIYALEREFFPRYKLKWRTHKRIHFCLDGEHPTGASQHQKIVVVDNTVAFCGGLDLSQWRWDTSGHRPDNEKRIDPDGNRYPPFHDVQMIVDGKAAQALGSLVHHRWHRACGQMPDIEDQNISGDIWPESVKPDLHEVKIAVARTMPKYKEHAEIREVEQLFIDSIAAADQSIYIENQYLSSHRIADALQERLREEHGPEIIVVMPKKTGGWLEQHTMDVMRSRILKRLRQADHAGRMRVYYPRVAVKPEVELMVHAKVMVVDDRLVRVGSANLSNRSMGLDSECDLAIAAVSDSMVSAAITRFRNRLLSEHLGVPPDVLATALTSHGSLIGAIDSLLGKERTLVPLKDEVPETVERFVPEDKLLDPEKPIEPDELFDYVVSPDQQQPTVQHFIKIMVMIALCLGLAAIWRWTPVGQWLDLDRVIGFIDQVRSHFLTPLLIPLVYVLAGLVVFPVTVLILATAVIFGPWWGFLYALLGAVSSALFMFQLGRLFGQDTVSRFSGSLINSLNRKLSKSGLLTVITFRIVPMAPFSLINLVAGVSKIQARDFLLGTVIGMLPGSFLIAITADRLSASIRDPDPVNFLFLLAIVVLAGLALYGLKRWLIEKKEKTGGAR